MNAIINEMSSLFSSERHLKQLVALKLTAGYYEYCCMQNKLGIDFHEAVKVKFVVPYLQHTKIILDDLDNIAGCYVALTKKDDAKIVLNNDWLRDDPDLQIVCNSILNLYNSIPNSDYVLHHYAVRFDLHGIIYPKFSRKISDLLFEDLLIAGRESKSGALSFMVWESHVPAIKLYMRYGGKVVRRIDLSKNIFSDHLLLMRILL